EHVVMQHPVGAFYSRLRVYASDHTLIGEGSIGGSSGTGSVLDLEVTAGLDYYLLCAPTDGTSIGVYTIEMTSLDPAPVVVGNGVTAVWDQVVGSTLVGGQPSVTFLNWWNRPIIATQQLNGSWTYTDLLAVAPDAGVVGGEMGRWVDGRDHRTYIAMRSTTGL